ncbi:TPA: hypothetical protein ACSP31_003202 [Aeromonas veronii]
MKRYNCTSSDKRGAFGLCMEEHEQGAFVPFSEISGLAEQLADATRQCGVMAELLLESHEMMRRIIPPMPQGLANRSDLLDRIEAALAGQFTLPAWYLDGAKDFKSMMLDASTALFHPHIEGVFAVFERRLALDGQPQGGEPCDSASPSSSPA